SKLKRGADGFAKYYSFREERLEKLISARVEITLFFDPLRYPDLLGLTISDSGKGFAHDSNSPSKLLGQDERSYGRGIALVESLCSSVSYNDAGNEVTVHIKLN
ncbi:ATP-binding protein, partial [Oleiphilus sp. HI0080]